MEVNHYLGCVLKTTGHVCCAITKDLKWNCVCCRNWQRHGLWREVWACHGHWIVAWNLKMDFENECVFCLVRRYVIQTQDISKLHFQTHFENQLSNPLSNPCSKSAFTSIIQIHCTNSSSPCYGLTDVTNGYPPLSFSSN